jgi:hypothetical protein
MTAPGTKPTSNKNNKQKKKGKYYAWKDDGSSRSVILFSSFVPSFWVGKVTTAVIACRQSCEERGKTNERKDSQRQ